MKVSDLVGDALAIAKAIMPLLPTGTAEIINAATSTVSLIDKIKTDLDSTPTELENARDELEAAVNAHATSTIDKLKG